MNGKLLSTTILSQTEPRINGNEGVCLNIEGSKV